MDKTYLKISNTIIDLGNVDVVNLQEDEKTVGLSFQFKDYAHSFMIFYDTVELAKKDLNYIWGILGKA